MKVSSILKGAALTGGALFIAKGLDNRLETTHYSISSEKIPPQFDGYRIVQISDLHASTVPGLADEVLNERPDIIALTGDLVHDYGPYDVGIRLAKRLVKIAPTYSVTGNHDLRRKDYKQFQEELDNTGVKTLHDTSINIDRYGAQITLSGIDDPISESSVSVNKSIKNSILSLPETSNYHILLFHRANHMDSLKGHGFDLVLSGHMHGGQMRLPGGRGVCAPRSSWGSGSPMLFPKYFAGHYKSGDMDMIVNRGIGNPMIVPRLFNRPEITVIKLKSKKSV